MSKTNIIKKTKKKFKTLNTLLKSIDSLVFIGATSTSINLSNAGFELLVVPLAAGIACGLSLGKSFLMSQLGKKIISTKTIWRISINFWIV